MPKVRKAKSRQVSQTFYGKDKRRTKQASKKAAEVDSKKPSAHLKWFLKVYKGLDDWHIPIFKQVSALTKARHVLYPGSYTHITPSLFFPSTVYVDCDQKVGVVFSDEQVLAWINENKTYSEKPSIKFLCKNFDSTFETLESFDLMISASAGIVSQSCAKYLKPGGYFLVSDAHFDARRTYLRSDFKLIGVYDQDLAEIVTDPEEIKNHFHTTAGTPISLEQVEESMQKAKSKRSFKLMKETMFYLFQKTL